jgi:hypothetical protein
MRQASSQTSSMRPTRMAFEPVRRVAITPMVRQTSAQSAQVRMH